jgi:Na+-translocating ferredoxin:NAD+ oxidoreductase RNF subunit RnfB
MNLALIFTAIVTIGGLTFLLASALVIADRLLHVEEDARIEIVEEMLPHTNCGACGYPGCHAFAEALVAGETLPGKCSVSSAEGHAQIATFLGVDVGSQEKQVARLACAGGNNVARHRAFYQGHDSCAAAALVAGGGKACFWGCLGLADCERACDFDAIEMDLHELPVVDEERCTACGDCVEACPKDLFSLHAISDRLWVACSSLDHGDEVLEDCEVACTACGRCAADAPNQIEMKNNLPVVNYRAGPLTAQPTQRCPTGAIVWIDPQKGPLKGQAARTVVRQGEIHDTAT